MGAQKWIFPTVFLAFLAAVLVQRHCVQAMIEAQDIIFTNITSPSIYNKRVRPSYAIGVPVVVNTSIDLYSMASTNDLHTEYTANLRLRLTWYDQRLIYDADSLQPDSRIQGDHWHAERLWLPSVEVTNTISYGPAAGHLESSTAPGSTSVLVIVLPDGTVHLIRKLNPKLTCEMEFHKYPLDKQRCSLKIESSTLSTSNMVLNWDPEESLQFSDNFAVTGFQMLDFNCSSHVSNFGKIGNFSMIMCEFTLKRDFGPFLLEIYIPGITFVITSWFSLWIDIPAAPARVTLAMTTFLTLVTGGKSIREKLPKVPYVHALDVWYLACTAFVFFILLEYAMVNYIYHKDNRRRQGGMRRIESQASLASAGGSVNGSTYINVISALEQAQHQHGGLTPGQSAKGQCAVQIKYKKNNNGNYNKTGGPTVLRLTDLEPHSLPDLPDTPPRSPMSVRSFAGDEPPFVCTLITPLTPRDIANGIDRHCRYIFPLAFIVFNAIYWSMLTSS
ncbi:glycine receptor subunit alphaZ1 isoform X1 [Dermacentor silvarum]|uniref:glycine receptor subunit alphaZ1 isoform X1 n=2 Tax=Dermacentor silvarum TaxID=543639 RepID=UPI0018979EE2|nr:glycine receptor subunit alphaZ1 isoform X1 [Dermacentor silvarum]